MGLEKVGYRGWGKVDNLEAYVFVFFREFMLEGRGGVFVE